MTAFLVLVVGFALLVWGADKFVDGASALAARLGIPSLIIGLTVVAFGTSAPELAVSVTAGLQGANEIAIGNVVGSNSFNLLVVAGLSAVIAPLTIESGLLRRDWRGSILATTALLLLVGYDGLLSRWDAGALLLGFGLVMFLQFRSAVLGGPSADVVEVTVRKPLIIALYMVLGLGSIILGGQLAVNGATDIARMFHISETVIGLTVVAIGTSLPELVTSLVATHRGADSIAIGNVIGSNLFNILFILGVSGLCSPIPVQNTAILDCLFLIATSVAVYLPAKSGTLSRKAGSFMVITYVGYMIWILLR